MGIMDSIAIGHIMNHIFIDDEKLNLARMTRSPSEELDKHVGLFCLLNLM